MFAGVRTRVYRLEEALVTAMSMYVKYFKSIGNIKNSAFHPHSIFMLFKGKNTCLN